MVSCLLQDLIAGSFYYLFYHLVRDVASLPPITVRADRGMINEKQSGASFTVQPIFLVKQDVILQT